MGKRKLLLDVGCGEAKCCLNFTKEGYDVIGVEKNSDIFKKAIVNVENSKDGRFVKLYNKDIRKFDSDNKFDGVLFNYVLMFMPKKDALAMIEKFYKKLNKKGEMIVKMLMFDDPVAIRSKEKNKDQVFFPSYNEFKNIEKKYKGELKFELMRDKPHGGYDFAHIHSIGILKIVK